MGTLCLLLSVASISQEAAAATVINRDTQARTLKIGTGSDAQSVILQPGATSGAICPKGCIIELVGVAGGSYEIEGGDTVSIEEGLIYYDDAPTPPSAGQIAPPLRGER